MTASDTAALQRARSSALMLMIMAGCMQFTHAVWMTLLNNFAVHKAGFTGAEIGFLQSLREIPGLLAFTAVFVLLFMREQTLALGALLLLGFGVAVTGLLPTFWGLCLTTLIMSVGFHYYETMAQSLSLQWLPKAMAPGMLGRIVSVGSAAAIAAYAMVFVAWKVFDIGFTAIYMIAGGITAVVVLYLWRAFPQFAEEVPQRKALFLRKRYWLYYALVFMSGARRQIFVVFAGFLLVEKFGYTVPMVAGLYLANQVLTTLLAPRIGALIGRFGERRALILEYIGLIGVFMGYALVTDGRVAGGLYVADHVFFAMAIAMRTYFQKIADPADIAPTAGVAFSISHIAAIVIPVLFGMIWLWSPALVFEIGAAMAGVSLLLALLVPRHPEPGREVLYFSRPLAQAAE